MRRSLLVVIVSSLVTACSQTGHVRLSAARRDSGSVNALWNDSGPDGQQGFWLYSTSGNCPDLRRSDPPLVFGMKSRRSDLAPVLDVSEMSHCFLLSSRADIPIVSRCVSGQARLTFQEHTNRYSGIYSFVMSDGTKREGRFEAAYCPKDANA